MSTTIVQECDRCQEMVDETIRTNHGYRLCLDCYERYILTESSDDSAEWMNEKDAVTDVVCLSGYVFRLANYIEDDSQTE